MRQCSSEQVVIRDVVIGGEKPLICLSLIAGKKAELIQQADELKKLQPVLLEWRADFFEQAEDQGACLDCLGEMRKQVGQIPLIFTLRSHLEGGQSKMSLKDKLALLSEVMVSGDADIIDVEMSNGTDFIDSINGIKEQTQTRLILSYHNFEMTPSEEYILDKLVQAQEMGADIAKIAVMPKNNADVLRLLSATDRARTSAVKIPIVTMSMGAAGAITRLAGGMFGSDITFAMSEVSSAPGQLPFADVKRVVDILY